MSIYSIVTVLMFVIYFYSTFKTQQLLSKIQSKVYLNLSFSKKKNYDLIKQLGKETTDLVLATDVRRYLFYVNLGTYTAFGGVVIFLLLFAIGVKG